MNRCDKIAVYLDLLCTSHSNDNETEEMENLTYPKL